MISGEPGPLPRRDRLVVALAGPAVAGSDQAPRVGLTVLTRSLQNCRLLWTMWSPPVQACHPPRRWRAHYSPGDGQSRLKPPQRMRPEAKIRVGSITKTFVSTVALQLVGEAG